LKHFFFQKPLALETLLPANIKLQREERSMCFSPEREAFLAEDIPKSLSPRRLYSSKHSLVSFQTPIMCGLLCDDWLWYARLERKMRII